MVRSALKGLSRIRKKWLLSSKSSATPVYGLCEVLQLRSINVNGVELQYQTQPTSRCGAVYGRKQPEGWVATGWVPPVMQEQLSTKGAEDPLNT